MRPCSKCTEEGTHETIVETGIKIDIRPFPRFHTKIDEKYENTRKPLKNNLAHLHVEYTKILKIKYEAVRKYKKILVYENSGAEAQPPCIDWLSRFFKSRLALAS